MLFLIQFDIQAEFDAPFLKDSHFLAFACREHDDISDQYYEDDGQLPPEFWNHTPGYYQLILNRPLGSEKILAPESRVIPQKLKFEKTVEEIEDMGYQDRYDGAKVGGVPHWYQFEEKRTCVCGAPMKFFGQLPTLFEFPKASGAPEQPNGVSYESYLLFLGNTNYFMACGAQCSPYAVISILQ